MAYRVPPMLPVPEPFTGPVAACMAAKPLQHQDELTMLLTWMAAEHRSFDTIVEIGSFRGGTLELWARLASCVISIDLPDPDQAIYPGYTRAAVAERNTDFARRFGHVAGILGDSHDWETHALLREHLANRPIDLLFIDGDHTFVGVKADYEMYGPLVRPGGVIAFHDIVCEEGRPPTLEIDVRRFFDTLPEPRQIFHAGAYWGGIGAIIAA